MQWVRLDVKSNDKYNYHLDLGYILAATMNVYYIDK